MGGSPQVADSVSASRIGRYQLISRLALGGMAEIFQARVVGIESFEKLVVLKRILPELNHDEQFIEMFLDEARLAAQLNHPNIAEVYDIGRADGCYFFTMEHVHGQNLSRVIRASVAQGAPLPIAEAVTIAIGAAAGLHHAHEKPDFQGRPLEIVHRDVSPSNILLRYDGCVKVVDFGIAKTATQHSHTRVGVVKGKLAYMSPEQVRGRPIDRRSDVFSLGIVLWELTCGRKLFRADQDHTMVQMIANTDAPPPSRYVKDYPPALEAIVMRALARDRDQRYPTAEAMQLALESFARERRLGVSQVLLARLMDRLFPGHPITPVLAPAHEAEPERTLVDATPRPDAGELELGSDGVVIDVMPLPDSQKTSPRHGTVAYVAPRSARMTIVLVATLATVALLAVLVLTFSRG